ncbi:MULTISPECIES: SRPBCC family protein [Mycolicibacterium]|uniref:SRPBCC family protein n=2 Tax=Mycobacteriaceae TaxID=1762 RepID=UPI00149079BF|nr:SRPBCC family protein [Mycolicibacterium fortuitum]
MVGAMVRTAAIVAALYGARRYYRNWGTTKDEYRSTLPGDELVGRLSVQSTEGVWIEAPAEATWPWLAQIGQERAGLYLPDRLQQVLGLGPHHADRILDDAQQLVVGDTVRLAAVGWLGCRRGIVLTVAHVIAGQAIVLTAAPPTFPWQAVWSLHVVPRGKDRCRVLVRTRARLRYPGQAALIELAGPLISLLTRAMLVGIRRRVQAASVLDTP